VGHVEPPKLDFVLPPSSSQPAHKPNIILPELFGERSPFQPSPIVREEVTPTQVSILPNNLILNKPINLACLAYKKSTESSFKNLHTSTLSFPCLVGSGIRNGNQLDLG
jgi:hypothetical protein